MEHQLGGLIILCACVFHLQKCMKFNVEAPIWLSKQRILCTLNQSLKDVLNYGLFQPAYNGKAGKFLDEQRTLKEYPLPAITPIPYLEVKTQAFQISFHVIFHHSGLLTSGCEARKSVLHHIFQLKHGEFKPLADTYVTFLLSVPLLKHSTIIPIVMIIK